MVGIGDIAQKAWLPAVSECTDVHASLVVRDKARREQVSAAWRWPVYDSLQALLIDSTPDWVTIHASTSAHAELVEQALRAGVSVLVDKPIATSFEEAARLQQLAVQNNCVLLTAFNRRVAPLYDQLGQLGAKSIQLSKHRHNLPGLLNSFLFDDFIHVLDTLLWWSEGPEQMYVCGTRNARGDVLELSVNWMVGGVRVYGEMSRQAGSTHERAMIIGENCHGIVNNMRFGEVIKDGVSMPLATADWQSVASQRGFVQLLQTLRNIAQLDTTYWTRQDLATHAWLSAIERSIEGIGEAAFEYMLTKDSIF